jgi:hypothetical protein
MRSTQVKALKRKQAKKKPKNQEKNSKYQQSSQNYI